MKVEKINSYTYHGKGGVLVITPGAHSRYDRNTDYYEKEAEKVCRFLKSVFCTEMLKRLKRKIPY